MPAHQHLHLAVRCRWLHRRKLVRAVAAMVATQEYRAGAVAARGHRQAQQTLSVSGAGAGWPAVAHV